MVIRVPVNLDVTDNEIADAIEDGVDRGARQARSRRAGNVIGAALGAAVGTTLTQAVQRGLSRIGTDIDLSRFTRGATAQLGGITDAFEAEGDRAGRGFATGLQRGSDESITTFGQLEFSLARVGAGATGLLAAVTPVGPALGGVAAGALAVAGAAGQAAGAALSFGGVLASLGVAQATARVASIGLSEAFEAQAAAQQELARTGEISESTQEALTQAMEGLAPAARNLVREVSALTPAWSDFQNSIQQTVFAGVAAQLEGISGAILPVLQRQLTGTAGVVNDAALAFADFAQSEQFISQLDALLAGLNDTLAALLPGVGGFGTGLLAIFTASTGPATDVAAAISDVGASFGTWAAGIADSGQLVTFLEQANVVLGDLLGIVGNVGSILVSVLGAGADTGAGLIATFRDLTGQLAAFVQTAGAQAGLEQFFGLVSQTGQTISELGAVIGPVFQGLFSVIGVLLPQINALRDALLPVAIVLGEAIGGALTALAPVVGLVAQLIVALVQALAPLVTTILGALAPAIAQIVAQFQGSLSPAITDLLGLLGPLLGILLEVFGAQVVNAIELVVNVLGGVFDILGGLINFLVGVFTGDWERAWDGIVQIFDGIVAILGAAVQFLFNTIRNIFGSAFPIVARLARQGWDAVVRFFQNAVRFHVQLVTQLVTRVVTGFNMLRSRAVSVVSALWSRVTGFFSNGIARARTAVLNGVVRIITAFVNLRSRILGTVAGFGSLLFNAGRNVVLGLINGIRSLIGSVGSAMSDIAGTIRAYLPFSPARVGPLSGLGSPENSGEVIAQMIADGIQQNINLPARAMERALAPLAPAPLADSTFGSSRGVQRAAGASETGVGGPQVQMVFTGPTTSGGRLQEMNWNLRYATQARREVFGGVPTA